MTNSGNYRAAGRTCCPTVLWIVSNPQPSLTPEISGRHLYKTQIAAGVRQRFLARGRAGRAMWTQRTGGGLWNCCLSRKNRGASCERPSPSGWEETAGRKPHLQSSERLSCELQGSSWLLVLIDLAFWPSSARCHQFSHMNQSDYRGLGKALAHTCHKAFHYSLP